MKQLRKLTSGGWLLIAIGVLPAAYSNVEVIEGPDVVEVQIKGKPVLTYHCAEVQPPEGIDPLYAGSGFIHPLYTPAGNKLTAAFPVGHAHQHGIFSAWTRTTFHHDMVDFWNKHRKLGYFEHAGVEMTREGAFTISRRQVSREHGPALEETWEVQIDDRTDIFIIDLTILQELATPNELILHRYHYGGFAFRGNERWNPDAESTFESEMNILTGLGTTDRELANHERPGWVAAYGRLGNEAGGVVIMDHPMNFRYPQPVRIHPQMPYFVFSPVVESPVIFEFGFVYKARYRIITFDGEHDPEKIKRWFGEYVEGISDS